ncbi:MAG: hypothetical protein R3357_02150 [Burkholderiales bacterium]|nr:hypothetical protein [Burkholderiales bacterium]
MSLRRVAVALLSAACTVPAQARSPDDALAQGDLICEFREGWRRSLIADLVGEPDPVALLLVYEAVTPARAEVLSSKTPGRRPVAVRRTDARVHFIERVGASVRVTTLTGCARSKWKDGADTCVRFPARHAWHFDTQALVEPDAAFARAPSGASVGACEPWKVD